MLFKAPTQAAKPPPRLQSPNNELNDIEMLYTTEIAEK